MKEAQFLGSLLPSHPNLIPIIQAIREKYNLPEISPDDDPIQMKKTPLRGSLLSIITKRMVYTTGFSAILRWRKVMRPRARS
jgi:hypothetical protein